MMLSVTLQVRKKNVLKDFVSVAGELGVSHFLIYTKSDINVHLRVCRLSRGPTLTFRVQDYTLCRDVVSALKKPNMDPKQFNHHPLLVMNNFSGGEMHIKLMSTMFQNMFPSININKVRTFRSGLREYQMPRKVPSQECLATCLSSFCPVPPNF